jgi:hypothetical protein
MRRGIAILLSILLLLPFLMEAQEETVSSDQEIAIKKEKYDYNPMGKRDPFRDILKIKIARRRTGQTKGAAGLYCDEVVLIGISKRKKDGKYFAIVLGPNNFPYFLQEGQRLADGYVYKITDNEVILKQETRSPVFLKPYKDIILRLTPSEED